MISVVIPTYNRPDLLEHRSIPSVLAQTYQDWELIVSGDGAIDGTAEAVARAAKGDPRIRFVNGPRQKYPKDPEARWRATAVDAFNRGLDLAAGEWVTGLGDDDELPPMALEILLYTAQSQGAPAAYGRAEVVGHGILGTFPPQEGTIAMALWRRNDYRMEVSPFPSDWDIWRRMIAGGVPFAFTGQIVYRYFPSSHVPETWPQVVAVIPTRFRPPQLTRLLDVLLNDAVIPIVLDSDRYDHRIHRMWNEGVLMAVKQHPGCVVAICNDDIEIRPGTLPLLARMLRKRPELGIIYPDEHVQRVPDVLMPPLPREPNIEYTVGPNSSGGITGFCFLFESFLRIPFDESYLWWYGDDDFEERVRLAGLKVGRAMHVPVWHRLNGSAIKVWEEIEPLTVHDRNLWESRHAR